MITMPLRQLDWSSASRYIVADPRWKSKIWTAGLVLLIPFIGWLALLGYRREAVFRLAEGASPILPNWEAGLWHYLRGGLQAVGVIHLYLSPLYLWFALRVANDSFIGSVPWVPVLLFFLAIPIFSTLIIPSGLIYARVTLSTLDVSEWELYALGAAFHLVVFFIPAGFLNVTRTRRMRSAFALWPAVQLIARHPRRYLEAWIGSSVMSLLGHFCLPFSPWGVVWCYLGITYLFNEVPHPEGGPYAEFRDCYWQGFAAAPNGVLTVRYEPIPGYLATWPRSPFVALRLGPIEAPIR